MLIMKFEHNGENKNQTQETSHETTPTQTTSTVDMKKQVNPSEEVKTTMAKITPTLDTKTSTPPIEDKPSGTNSYSVTKSKKSKVSFSQNSNKPVEKRDADMSNAIETTDNPVIQNNTHVSQDNNLNVNDSKPINTTDVSISTDNNNKNTGTVSATPRTTPNTTNSQNHVKNTNSKGSNNTSNNNKSTTTNNNNNNKNQTTNDKDMTRSLDSMTYYSIRNYLDWVKDNDNKHPVVLVPQWVSGL